MQTHPDALQTLCEEVERTAWVADRSFFSRHPKRKHRIRKAFPAEVGAHEVLNDAALQVPQGTCVFVAVRQLAPGVRMRFQFVADDMEPWRDPGEAAARRLFERVYARFDPRPLDDLEAGMASELRALSSPRA